MTASPGPDGPPGPPAPADPPGRDLLAGKVVVITAAAGTGIGSAVARRCLAEGAQVMLSDQHERRLAATQAELAGAHGGTDRVAAQPCDVTDEAQVSALIDGGRTDSSAASTSSSATPASAAPPPSWR